MYVDVLLKHVQHFLVHHQIHVPLLGRVLRRAIDVRIAIEVAVIMPFIMTAPSSEPV